MNPLQSIAVFLRVAELSSFSQAARQLGLPNASVSTMVRDPETLLGTRLLHRTTRQVQLTSDGEAFYDRSKDLVADMCRRGYGSSWTGWPNWSAIAVCKSKHQVSLTRGPASHIGNR